MKVIITILVVMLLMGCKKEVIEYREVLAAPPVKRTFFGDRSPFNDQSSMDVTTTTIECY